jgi:hypothetical protein
MITRSEAVIPANHAADWTGKEGLFVESAAGVDTICNAATDIPIGVITEGQPKKSSLATPAFGGTVKVKLHSSAGAVVRGSYLCLHTDGSVLLDPGSGNRVRVARALEAGANSELIEAYLIEPTFIAA